MINSIQFTLMNWKGAESSLLYSAEPCYSVLFSGLYQLQLPEEQCGGIRSVLSAFWHKEPFLCGEQLQCASLLVMLWTAKSLLNTLLIPAAKSVYSVPQFDRCRNKLYLRQSIQTSSNRPECERLLVSAQLLCCSWCCWWWLFKSMTTEALSTLSVQTLIIHSFRCSTFFFLLAQSSKLSEYLHSHLCDRTSLTVMSYLAVAELLHFRPKHWCLFHLGLNYNALYLHFPLFFSSL